MSEVPETLEAPVGQSLRSFEGNVEVSSVALRLIEEQDLNPFRRVEIKVLPLKPE